MEVDLRVVEANIYSIGDNLNISDGDVVIGKLIVESGATFNASCSMNKEGKTADFKLVNKPDETHEKTA